MTIGDEVNTATSTLYTHTTTGTHTHDDRHKLEVSLLSVMGDEEASR